MPRESWQLQRLCGLHLGSPVSSNLPKHAARWNSTCKLALGVNECVGVCTWLIQWNSMTFDLRTSKNQIEPKGHEGVLR